MPEGDLEVGRQDPRGVAMSLRQRLGLADHDYLDFDVLMALWPTLSVIDVDIDKAGYLINFGDGGEILLRKSDPVFRRRFTWAHEIGHWLLAEPCSFAAPTGVSTSATGRDVEHWCDEFAADLLIPTSFVRSLPVKGGSEAVDLVLKISRQFRVSLTASLTQVADAFGVAGFYIPGERNPRVQTVGTASVPPGVRSLLRQMDFSEPDETRTIHLNGRTLHCRRAGRAAVFGLIE